MNNIHVSRKPADTQHLYFSLVNTAVAYDILTILTFIMGLNHMQGIRTKNSGKQDKTYSKSSSIYYNMHYLK